MGTSNRLRVHRTSHVYRVQGVPSRQELSFRWDPGRTVAEGIASFVEGCVMQRRASTRGQYHRICSNTRIRSDRSMLSQVAAPLGALRERRRIYGRRLLWVL